MTREEKIAEARRLREQGLSYLQIGKRLGVTNSCAYKWLNPERAQEYVLRADRAPGRAAQKRAWENEHDRKPCSQCDRPRGVGSHRGPRGELCASCYNAERRTRRLAKRERIQSLWAEGKSLAAIAKDLGTTTAALGVEMAQMRDGGWNLPYRRLGPRQPGKHPELRRERVAA